jgi:hypothetical protein
MKKTNRHPILLLTLFAVLVSWLSTTDAVAQQPTFGAASLPVANPVGLYNVQPQPAAQANACNELQVIFIVDQSGSMFGFTDNTGRFVPPTDPLGLRFAAPENAFDRLGAYRYQRYEDANIQFAVIYFGDRAQTQIPWTEITPESRAEFESLQQAVSPLFPLGNSLGETLVQAPFEIASSLFIQVEPQVDGCPTRAVIVITDGQPYVSTAGFNWQNHLRGVDSYVQQYMPPPDHRIYVIGVDEGNRYWPATRPFWEDITGDPDRVFRAQNQSEMASLILRITSELMRTLGEGLVSGCVNEDGILDVPGSMQKIYISLSKWDASVHLEVQDALGRVININNYSSFSDVEFEGITEPIETIIIENPHPGPWQVLTTIPAALQDACAVSFDALTAVKKPIAPIDGDQLIQFRKTSLQFQLVDANGNPLPDYNSPDYDLQMDVKIWNSGVEKFITSGANPGQVYINNDFIPLDPGQTALSVTATSRNRQGERFTILNDETLATFTVLPVTFELLTGPSPGAILEQYVEFPLSFALVAGNSQPISIDLPLRLNASITHVDSGEQFTLNLPLSADDTYNANFTPGKPGEYRLEYTAAVDTPQTQVITEGELSWNVFPVIRMSVDFVSPKSMVATDPFLNPTGLEIQIQLIGDDGQPVTASAMGVADPNAIFSVKVLDGDGNELSGHALIQTGTPGGYQLRRNELGHGNYTVVIEPIAVPARGYAWEQISWQTELNGTINPLFYTYLILAILLALALLLFIIVQIQVRLHPLSGKIQILAAESDMDGNTFMRPIYTASLPSRNRVTLRPNISHEAGATIKRIKLKSPNKRAAETRTANVEIQHTDGSKWTGPLPPNSPTQPRAAYTIVKDPSVTSFDGGDASDLSGEF